MGAPSTHLMNTYFSKCPCQTAGEVSHNKLLGEFENIRKQCPVLKNIVVPDKIWNDFKKWAEERDDAEHISMFLLALEYGYLNKLTSPIHRYCIEGEEISSKLKEDYKIDLRERWLEKGNCEDRHRKSRGYMGKLTELIYAEHLETIGYKIIGLEAWGAKTDIIASKNEEQYRIEIKYIGQEDYDFQSTVTSLQGNSQYQRLSPYTPLNFLLLKIYESAKQLQNHETGKRIAVIAIAKETWHRFHVQLGDGNWIQWWEKPAFFTDNDPKWDSFYTETVLKKYPRIETEMSSVLNKLFLIKIIKYHPKTIAEDQLNCYKFKNPKS